ncbi:MAG TPA: sugar ABC transporter ATP-binding protein [Chthoniobacterales bacterium]|nr:sugar ABC transporter ATP-binding protein [Chthoniobacterales bacterium]
MTEILQLRNVSKTFPGVRALQNISFELKEGEVHCLCGENGAGKSTLIKILSGAYQPDEGGEILFEGRRVILNPHFAMQMGIQTIYQEHVVFETLSIVENIFTGSEIVRHGLLQKREMRRQTTEVLRYLKSDLSPDKKMGELSSGEQKTVEIAKGLIFKRRVIILDEPTASFSAAEIENLLDIIQTVKNSGLGIIYISHHLEEVFRIADRVTVLRDGRKVSVYESSGLAKESLIKDMVGRDPSTFYQRERVPIGEVVLEARNVTGNGAKNISFALKKGEILGIAGMTGSGRSELMNVLFGSARLQSGVILVRGKVIKHPSPEVAIKNKLCFITEDRQSTGLFLPQSIAQNVTIANLVNTKEYLVRHSDDYRTGDRFVNQLKIKANDSRTHVVNLSGGNQQKVVLAKWFNTNAEIFIFDEPTIGIDVGSKQEIYKLMVDLLKEGKAIIMVSSDMPEVISMSDRVLVMKNGRVTAELMNGAITEENILNYSIGEPTI